MICLVEKFDSLLDKMSLKFYIAHVLREMNGWVASLPSKQGHSPNEEDLGTERIKQEKGSGGFYREDTGRGQGGLSLDLFLV